MHTIVKLLFFLIDRGFPSPCFDFEIFCWIAGEPCQVVSPASWSDHMLPIKAEDHVAGQQLNVRKTAQHVFSNGINCYSNEAPMEEQVHTFSILSHSECLHAAASLPSMLF